jgi:hypothetical protein
MNAKISSSRPRAATMAGLIVGALQVIGVVTALIAGVVATRANYRKPPRNGRAA